MRLKDIGQPTEARLTLIRHTLPHQHGEIPAWAERWRNGWKKVRQERLGGCTYIPRTLDPVLVEERNVHRRTQKKDSTFRRSVENLRRIVSSP